MNCSYTGPMTKTRLAPNHFRSLYAGFQAPVSKFDCGRKCAPLNGGEPVCCTTGNAIPIVEKVEFAFLKTRTDLWSRYKPKDASSRKIVEELPRSACAIECKGVQFCERENRTIACRAFPFYPYLTAAGDFIGLSVYWTFEDRCWMISRLDLVEKDFISEMAQTFTRIFDLDPAERETMLFQSATARRVFSRWKRPLPVVGLDGKLQKVMPHTHELRPAKLDDFRIEGPYASEAAYKKAVKEAGGSLGPRPAKGYLAP